MRELSCGSSLGSYDDQENEDDLNAEAWNIRYNTLHKRYMTALEQKVCKVVCYLKKSRERVIGIKEILDK